MVCPRVHGLPWGVACLCQGEDEDSLKQDLENKTANYSGLICEDFNERLREKSGKWKEGKEGFFFWQSGEGLCGAGIGKRLGHLNHF